MNFSKKRFDCFIIWGHGLQYKDVILEQLHNESNFSIKSIIEHTTKNIRKLVKVVYSHDYAPYRHLRNKTKYLLKTPPVVLFIFLENQDVLEALHGKGKHLHVECFRIKALKENFRNQFNPRNADGKRTEHHVVHATDNELQTSKMVKYLGLGDDCRVFENANHILKAPYHLRKIHKFQIRRVNLDQIKQRISSPTDKSHQLVSIAESLHYRYLQGESEGYLNYYNQGRGKELKDPHFAEDFKRLSDNLNYLGESRKTDYIILKKISESNYVIRDGSHRCAALYRTGQKSILAVIT